MQSPQNSFVLYPLGRLYSIIPDITQFLSIQNSNLVQNWSNAANNDDLDTMLSVATIFNYWKESQLLYRVPKEEMRVYGQVSCDIFIIHAFYKLTQNDNFANKKVCLILTEILSFFYTKFKNIKDFVDYNYFLQQIIESISMLLVLMGSEYKGNEANLVEFPESSYVKEALKQWILFLQPYDGKSNNKETASQQMKTEIEELFAYMVKSRYLDTFLSTIFYIKMEFLMFFENFYNNELQQFNRKNQQLPLMKRVQQNTLIETPKIQTSSIQYMDFLYRRASGFISNHKFLFCYLHPLLNFLPKFMMNCTIKDERQFVFSKLYLKIIGLLNKICGQDKINYEQEFNLSKTNNVRDLIRAFKSTTLLNDLEIVLVGFQEDQIHEHKEVPEYIQQYQQILGQFELIGNIKRKITSSFDEIYTRLTEQCTGMKHLLEQINKLQLHDSNNSQQQYQQKTTQTRSSNPVTLSIYENNKKGGKRSKGLKQMDGIMESNQKDQQTTHGENQSKREKLKQSKLKQGKHKQGKHKHRKESVSQQTDEGQNNDRQESLDLNIAPLEKNRNDKVSQKPNLPKITSNNIQAYKIQSNKNQVISQSKSYSTASTSRGSLPMIQNRKSFVTYYQHHYHPFQSMQIFRSSINSYLHNKKDEQSQDYSGRMQTVYPTVIQKQFYETRKYSALDNKIHISDKLLDSALPTAYNQLRQKRSNVIHNVSSIQSNKNKNKNKKKWTSDQLQQVRNAKQINFKTVNELTKLQFQIKSEEYGNQKIQINLFPLATTMVGMQTIQSLIRCVQQFMRYFTLKWKPPHSSLPATQPIKPPQPTSNPQQEQPSQQNNQPRTRIFRTRRQMKNPFSQKVLQLKQPYEIQTTTLRGDYLMSYFFAIVYDMMVCVEEREEECQGMLQEFYRQFFSRLELSLQAVLLYYMYEMQRYLHVKFENLLGTFISSTLGKKELIAVTRFYVIELKLQHHQFNHIYLKLYNQLSNHILSSITYCLNLLLDLDQIVENVFKQSNQHTRGISSSQNSQGQLEKPKQSFYLQLSLLIDMIQLWMVMTFGIYHTQHSSLTKSSITLPFYCPYCSSIQFIKPLGKERNYQDVFCATCSNSLLYRFQLQQPNAEFINQCQEMKIKLQKTLRQCIKRVEISLGQNTQNINQPAYHRYSVPGQTSLANNQPIHRTQKSSMKANQTHLQKKSKEEIAMIENHQFYLNNCKILTYYFRYVTQLITRN